MIRSNKGEGPLQGLIVAVLITSFVAFTGFSFLAGLSLDYNQTFSNESQYTVFNQYTAIQEDTEALRLSLTDSGGGFLSLVDNLFTGAWNTLQLFLLSIPQTFYLLVNELALALGIPMFGDVLTAIILTIVVFAILALIMKVRA